MYNFRNLTEKDRIYNYWNHSKTGYSVCDTIYKYFENEKFNFCEIGCQLAGLSDLILHEFDNSNVYSIDIINHNKNVIKNLKNNFPNRFKFILESSLVSYNLFENEFFDIIYIDTDPHKYDQLKKEIELWIPKVKKNGVIFFHDYDHSKHPDVKKCIDEYCEKEKKQLIKLEYYNVYINN